MPTVNLMPRSKNLASQAKPASKTSMTKVEFILTLPADMPARDAVAKAEAAGHTLSQQRVHAIRWAAKHATKKGKALAKAAPTAKTGRVAAKPVRVKPATVAPPKRQLAAIAKLRPSKAITKTAYILGFPPSTPAADIVAKAKVEGIKLTIGHVYSTRTAAKAKAARKSQASLVRPPVVVRQSAKLPVRTAPGTSSLEQQFLDLVLAVGLARAAELLGKLRDRVRHLALG